MIKIKEEEVLGINNRYELSFAEQLAQKKLRDHLLKTGITLSPETTFLSYNSVIEKDVIIHPNVIIGKNVTIKKIVKFLLFHTSKIA